MKHLLIYTVLLLAGSVLSAREAGQAPPPASPDTITRDTVTESTRPASDKQSGQTPAEDTQVTEDGSVHPPPPSSRFDPSEKISDDLSVSFPVDI